MTTDTPPGSDPPSSAAYQQHRREHSSTSWDGSGSPGPTPSKQQQQQQPLREMGGLAAWSVTSAKPGNGVDLLRDGSTDTFWQSDGTQPHLINAQFNRRTEIAELHLYLDFKADESYTPARLAVRAGCSFNDLKDVCIVELREPTGWVVVPLAAAPSSSNEQQQQQPGDAAAAGTRGIGAFVFQVAVLANHQNGRDTHIRQVLLFGPSAQDKPAGGAAVGGGAAAASRGSGWGAAGGRSSGSVRDALDAGSAFARLR